MQMRSSADLKGECLWAMKWYISAQPLLYVSGICVQLRQQTQNLHDNNTLATADLATAKLTAKCAL